MCCGFCNVYLMCLVCSFSMLTGITSEPVKRQPPTFKIIREGSDLSFIAHAPDPEFPHCWIYMFQYSKCNEKPFTINVTEDKKWTAKVPYDSACKYTVKLQAIFETKYCGEVRNHSDMSKPVYFGQNGDPNFPFKVAMVVIPITVCVCLIIAIVLFRRHKDKVFPRVPSPSHLFKDLYDSNKETTKILFVGELYVPNEEVVEEIHVEPKNTHLCHGF